MKTTKSIQQKQQQLGMSEAYFLRIPLGKPSAPAVKGLKALT